MLLHFTESLVHFQYLLKYSTFTVLMDHTALKSIYCSCMPAKTKRIQKCLEEISDFSFDFQHISGKHFSYHTSRQKTMKRNLYLT